MKKRKINPLWGKGKSSWNRGVPRTKATKDKISASMQGNKTSSYGKKGEDAYGWRGDKVGRSALHKWVERCKGKAKNHVCAHCKKVRARDWSNKKHDYKRKLDDYVALCVSCHRKWDAEHNSKKKVNKSTVSSTFEGTLRVKCIWLDKPIIVD